MTIVYITKYALTDGPYEVDAELSFGGQMAHWRPEGSYMMSASRKEFWLSKDEALADCERRRKAKLASIDKQRAKLKKMEFKL
ncbi:hypothetical protein [Buttiauxella noackiae]|uniref:hypothetical protein n=1 Tax=Buttiauxella noackiae TaxID=82992 RepID=UPI0028D36496|nr:hypothetical protein [Buttiauxella noackiae]